MTSTTVNASRALDHIYKIATLDAADCETHRDQFIGRLQSDFENAMRWSTEAFKYAARWHAAHQLQAMIKNDRKSQQHTDDEILEELEKTLEQNMLQYAANPSFSTSPTSNLNDVFHLKAWTHYHKVLQNCKHSSNN